MDFFGSPWRSIIKGSLLSLCPEKMLELLPLEVLRVCIYDDLNSGVAATLGTPGQIFQEPVLTIRVDTDKFLSALTSTTFVASVAKLFLRIQEKDQTVKDSDKTDSSD